jgi:NADH-quinone oxidoreductase subunit D
MARWRPLRVLSETTDLCRGCLIADVPAIFGSIDVVMGEVDR